MGRRNKIWRRKADGHWYTTVNGKKVKVAEGDTLYREAFKKFAETHLKPTPSEITVPQLCSAFLRFIKANQSEKTWQWCGNFLTKWCNSLDPSLRASDAKASHVQEWLDTTDYADNTKNCAIRAIVWCFNWGVDFELIEKNPLNKIPRPTPTPREVVITQQQYNKMLKMADDSFGDYLTFLWETGARAQEIRLIESRHFDDKTITLERSNSKGKKYPRVIYLNQKAVKLVKRLARRFPKGPLFRNADGEPWTANAVRCRFKRMNTKLKIKGLCATAFRHTFCTNALKNGLNTTTVSILMGHRDTSMVERVYQHLARDHEYLAEAAERARGNGILPLAPADVIGSPQSAVG